MNADIIDKLRRAGVVCLGDDGGPFFVGIDTIALRLISLMEGGDRAGARALASIIADVVDADSKVPALTCYASLARLALVMINDPFVGSLHNVSDLRQRLEGARRCAFQGLL